jgi:hypothetical protein
VKFKDKFHIVLPVLLKLYLMIVFCDLFKITLVWECRGYSKMKSVFKGYFRAKRLGTAALGQ